MLSGSDPRQFGRKIADLFTGRNPSGGNVELTLNKSAQEAAYAAMKGPNGQLRRGAVVAIDPDHRCGAGRGVDAVLRPEQAQFARHQRHLVVLRVAAEGSRATDAQPRAGSALPARFGVQGDRFRGRVEGRLQADAGDSCAATAFWPFGGHSGPCNGSTACIQNFDGETCQNGSTATADLRVREVVQHRVRAAGGRAAQGAGHRQRGAEVRLRRQPAEHSAHGGEVHRGHRRPTSPIRVRWRTARSASRTCG